MLMRVAGERGGVQSYVAEECFGMIADGSAATGEVRFPGMYP